MRSLLSILAVGALLGAPAGHAAAGDECRSCHTNLDDRPSRLYRTDVHAAVGMSCAACHGGDSSTDDMDKAMARSAGFIGVPKGDSISVVCASCHADPNQMRSYGSALPTDQWTKLQRSVHGRPSTSGGTHIAQCTTCHEAHGVLRVSHPRSPVYALNVVATCARCHSNAGYIRMYDPALPVDQLEKYRTSVHGVRNRQGDPSVAECASCHGSHDILPATEPTSRTYPTRLPGTCAACHSDRERMKRYDIPTDQYEKFARSVHGVALLERQDVAAPACNSCHGNHGATPPGVASIAHVCGTCHTLNADLFAGSPHKKAFDERQLPECATCHGNHEVIRATNSLLGTSSEAVCSRCHSPTQSPAGYAAAGEMRQLVDSLETSEEAARAIIHDAEQKGMEVSEPGFKIREIRQARLESKTVIHSFDEGRVRETVTKGLTVASQIRQAGEDAIDEYYFRRIGLGISTLIITILAVSLALYIRRLERGEKSPPAAERSS